MPHTVPLVSVAQCASSKAYRIVSWGVLPVLGVPNRAGEARGTPFRSLALMPAMDPTKLPWLAAFRLNCPDWRISFQARLQSRGGFGIGH